MTDATNAAEAAAAATIAAVKAAAEKAAAEAKTAHEAAVNEIAAAHAVLDTKIEDLKASLAASLEKATADANHLGYAASFIARGHLLVDEYAAWIKRHV
jgi:hypothetical protein